MSEAADVAALKVKVAHLEEKMDEAAKDLKAIRETLAELRGGKRALWIIWSVLGMALTAVGTYFTIKGN